MIVLEVIRVVLLPWKLTAHSITTGHYMYDREEENEELGQQITQTLPIPCYYCVTDLLTDNDRTDTVTDITIT